MLEHGLRDPISGEFGKTIAFAVSQNHAAKIAQILNEMADQLWPGRYKSDFAMQVTSHVTDAQRMTVNFANNNLGGHSEFAENYRTSRARVCVTVGMMTTGYDCPDLLNIALSLSAEHGFGAKKALHQSLLDVYPAEELTPA